MGRSHAALWLPVLCCVSAAQAGESGSAALCRTVAHDLWTHVATAPLHEQTPLAQLTTITRGMSGLTRPGQSIADTLTADHAAGPDLVQRLRDLSPTEATRFGASDIWLLDRMEGTLGCHTPMTVAVPPSGSAHEIELPGNPDPTGLCALSALAAVSIGGSPALWIEQSGSFSNSLVESTVSVAALQAEAPEAEVFAAPCTLVIDYAVGDQATHAFCNGVDCVPLTRAAEVLAMRLRQQETAETLGAGVIRNEQEAAEFRHMADIAAADTQPADLPTFGVSLDTPYVTFADRVIFPMRLADGSLCLVQMGHGGFGWRQTADTLLAFYRLHDDQLVPAASVYVSARRTGIIDVAIQ